MNDQNNTIDNAGIQSQAPQQTPQPIIINNVVADKAEDEGKKKAPGFFKVCAYSFLTGGIYFFYWLVKSLSGGYRQR